eukprot:c20673_g2_i1 orf=451-1212(+)
MGSPARIVVPDPSQEISCPAGSIYSPTETESCATPSSLSSTDTSSSSFAQSSAHGADSASILSPKSPSESPKTEEEKHHQKKKHVLGRQRNDAEVMRIRQGAHKEPLRDSKRALMDSRRGFTVRVSMRKACCRCAGAFAADCAALCCCPCAIFSFLAFILVDLPSRLASKMITHLKKRLCLKDSLTTCSSRSEDKSASVFTSTWSYRESCEGIREQEAVTLFRFDTQNLLKHFEAENVGFGCLSQKREESNVS